MPGSVSHAKNHDIVSRDHTGSFKKISTFIVSGSGNDTTGDGSIMKPFKTANKAITEGLAVGDSVEVICDDSITGETIVLVPEKEISLVGLSAQKGMVGMFRITINEAYPLGGGTLRLKNIKVRLTAVGTLPTGTIIMEGGEIDSTIVGSFTAIDFYFSNTWIPSTFTPSAGKGIALSDAGGVVPWIRNFGNIGANGWLINQTPITGNSPVNADMSGTLANTYQIGVGLTGRIFLMYNTGTPLVPVVKYVELT